MLRPILLLLLATALHADTLNYVYDAAGRLIRVDYPTGTSIAYSYDPAGNLLSRTVTMPPAAAQCHHCTLESTDSPSARPRGSTPPRNSQPEPQTPSSMEWLRTLVSIRILW